MADFGLRQLMCHCRSLTGLHLSHLPFPKRETAAQMLFALFKSEGDALWNDLIGGNSPEDEVAYLKVRATVEFVLHKFDPTLPRYVHDRRGYAIQVQEGPKGPVLELVEVPSPAATARQ